MYLEILSFLLSSAVLAAIIAFKISSDIYPHALKKLLNRIALTNWINRQPQKFGSNPVYDPTCTEDLAILASDSERRTENMVQSLGANENDDILFYGIDDNGNTIAAQITRSHGNKSDCRLYVSINGNNYSTSRQEINSTSHEFTCGTFKLEMIEPMRAWRIWYNGILENEADNADLVHVTLNFLWKALEKPMDSRKDANVDLLSNYLTQNGSFGENLADLRRILPEGYSQFGTLHGLIKLDDIEMPPLYLYGFRTRRFISRSSSSKSEISRLELFGMCGTDGNAFKLEGLNDGWIDGLVYYPSYQVNPILNVSDEPASFLTNHSLPKLFNINDKVKEFRIEIWPQVVTQKFPGLEVTSLKLKMNGKEARGFLVRRKLDSYQQNLHSPRDPISFALQMPSSEVEAVRFDSDLCLNVSLVGGKGASLAKLTKIAKMKDVEFRTAKGFCLTTSLFSSALDIDKMRNIFSTAQTEIGLEKACFEVMNLIKSSNVEGKIRSVIDPLLEKEFGKLESNQKIRFAVRSSGILEDASDLSCAGQNETFLGVMRELIPLKVIDCWASLFTPQSVLYRINHGQPAMSEMGIAIQEMVDAKAAGVIFSADPRTGNPFEMIINANFGLGESVVSATCDPDNITITRSRQNRREINPNNNDINGKELPQLTIGKKVLGEKKIKTELSQDGKSTEEIAVNDDEKTNYSVNDEIALRLGKIVVKLEEELRDFKPIDVEWALHKDGTIFVLQSRHITALDSWTDFEIIHEMDSALRTNFERNTTANTGEVMPGASSPLSISVVTRILDVSIQRRMNKNENDPIVSQMIRSCSLARQRVMLNVINLMYKNNNKEIGPTQVALDLTVFGHRVITEELHRIGIERFGIKSGRQKILFLLKAVKNVWESEKEVVRVEKKYASYKIDLNDLGDDSRAIYDYMSRKIFDMYDITRTHCCISEASGLTQMFAFLTLTQGKHVDKWDSTLYEDVSKILAVRADVESADVPSAMDKLASAITDCENEKLIQDFTESVPSAALKLLQSTGTLNTALEIFFDKHGHRCIAELDLSRKSWKSDPIPFIQLLQSIVRNKIKSKETWKGSIKKPNFSNDDELLNSMKTTLTSGTKRFLKFILYYCRNATRDRERTKSLLVQAIDQLKPTYERLAQIMKKEHLIPDGNLVHFMTHHEIGLVISGDQSASRILYKARRRLKLHPALMKEEFPEISVGMIEPINHDVKFEFGDSIQATPLSSGKVQAAVKVCMNVEEATKLIEPGDILVTIGTDIGWSPFFPMLGGIVTELGGLMSHGAVVAREYGLPCIVGAANATKIFKSGEQVVLDAGKGTLTKIKL